MARCWSCGSDLAGGLRHIFTCPLCSQVEETKKIRERLESSGAESLYGAIESVGFEITEGLSEIASILEWGFEEIEWQLDQIGGTLRSIDETLKTPSATQANEWRQIAEELRRRGLLDESEKFFSKSLETNPLDYRTYIGLGKTYLQLGDGGKARTYWEKSLPHAPKREIDYQSYSYRLIGRTYFCEDNPHQAAATLKTAIELSPNYYLGHYDYAQYCALIGDIDNCLASLRIAVFGEPSLLELAEKERNLLSRTPREQVGLLLKNFLLEIKYGIEFWVRKKFGVNRYLELVKMVQEMEEIKSLPEFRKVLELLAWEDFLKFTQILRDIKEIEKVGLELSQKYGKDVKWKLDFARIEFDIAIEFAGKSEWSTERKRALIEKAAKKVIEDKHFVDLILRTNIALQTKR